MKSSVFMDVEDNSAAVAEIVNMACEREIASCFRSIAADVDGVTAMDGMRFERGSDTLPGAATTSE